MSDKLPGSSWSNPIIYGNWSIGTDDLNGITLDTFAFCHDGYDSEDPLDTRCGYAGSIDAAKAEIDLRESQDADTDEPMESAI